MNQTAPFKKRRKFPAVKQATSPQENLQAKDVKQQEFTLVTSSDKPLHLTVGLEYELYILEKHQMGLNFPPFQQYDDELRKEKKQEIVGQLNIFQFFPEVETTTPYICLIKVNSHKKFKPFLKVIFDDPGSKSQIEFVSYKIGGGILTFKDFFSEKNLQKIKDAVTNFPSIVKRLTDNEGTIFEEEGNQYFQIDSGVLRYIFPSFAREIFLQLRLCKNDASIHISHIFPKDLTDEPAVLKFIKAANPGSFRKKFCEKRLPNFVRLQIPTRTNFSPNPKIPTELIRNDMASTLQPVLQKTAMVPRSNIIKYAEEDIRLYQELTQEISTKIDKLKGEKINIQSGGVEEAENEDAGVGVEEREHQAEEVPSEEEKTLEKPISQINPDEHNELDILVLELAQNKLHATMEAIQNAIDTTRQKENEKMQSSLQKKKKSLGDSDLLLYDSYEEKFIYVEQENSFLIEHRCGELPARVAEFMNPKIKNPKPSFDKVFELLNDLEKVFESKDKV